MEFISKKTLVFTALSALVFPFSLNALGLGELSVESALDQPFSAEIALIDIPKIDFSQIKVSLVKPNKVERLGIATSVTLDVAIKRNEHGRPVVWIHSNESIAEPYMQLVVDISWPQGNIVKAYTVLLDPPNYQLQDNSKIIKPFVEGTKVQGSYGPIGANENVWQIAQRYKSAEAILPQVVLAIVGKNPQAFRKGNLNGLIVGESLSMPPKTDYLKVPADLATVEVMAHDKAWNEKTGIVHVLSPPYINRPLSSTLPAIPQLMTRSSLQPQEVKLKTELSVTSAAINSLRESNSMFIEQIHLLQKETTQLRQQLTLKDKELHILQKQLDTSEKIKKSGFGSWCIFLCIFCSFGIFGYWYALRTK